MGNIYGVAGASGFLKARSENELIVALAVERVVKAFGPYLLVGDVNCDPSESPSIAAAVEAGLLIDVAHAATPSESNTDQEGNLYKTVPPTF